MPGQRWTYEDVPGPRLAEVPVYVLTSGFSFSAAESFTFGLKINDRITQVGERIGGGGYWGQEVDLGHRFVAFVPEGRTFDPETGEAWEAEGLEPDLAVPHAEALDTALADARQRIGSESSN